MAKSPVNKRLAEFLIGLSFDVALRERFATNPEEVMAEFGLDPRVRGEILSRDLRGIRESLFLQSGDTRGPRPSRAKRTKRQPAKRGGTKTSGRSKKKR